MLPVEARQILAKLETLSHGTITGYNKSGGAKSSEHPGGNRPSGDSYPPHIHFRLEMEARPHDIPRLIEQATEVWKNVTGRDTVKVKRETKTDAELVIEDGKGFTPYEVSLKFRCSETTIRRIRFAAGLDTENGEPHREVPEPDRLTEAIRLRKQGASYRTIEDRTGVKRSTLFDAMKRAA